MNYVITAKITVEAATLEQAKQEAYEVLYEALDADMLDFVVEEAE